MPLTFGNATSPLASRLLGSPPPDDFAALSAAVRRAWTAFAATGDPGWPRFDLIHRRTRLWATPPTDAPYSLEDSRRIWEHVVPR